MYKMEPRYFSEKDLLDIFIGTMAVRYNDFTQEIDNLNLFRYLLNKFGYKNAYKIFDDVIPYSVASTTCMIQKDYYNIISYNNDKSWFQHRFKVTSDIVSKISFQNLSSIKSILNKRNNLLKKLGISIKNGSYALVASSRVNKTKVSVVYGGPQMGYFKPPALFCIGLHCPQFDIIGTTIPGYIFFIFASNRNLAFTATAGIGNIVDIIAVKKDQSSNLYTTLDGKKVQITTIKEKIKVKNKTTPIEISYEISDLGPVISSSKNYKFIKYRGWKDNVLNSYYAWFESNFAQNIDEYLNASDKMTLAINWLVADKYGNIGCVHTGIGKTRFLMGDDRLPTSKIPNFIYPDVRIAEVNTPSGWYANWNCSPIKNYKIGDLQTIWLEDQRTAFIVDLISKNNIHIDLDYIKKIEKEIAFTDLRAYFYKDKLLSFIKKSELNSNHLRVYNDLLAWDNKRTDDNKDGLLDNYSAGVFDLFWNKIFEKVFEPVLGSYTWMVTSDSTWTQSAILLRALERNTNFDYFYGQDISEVITRIFIDTVDKILKVNGTLNTRFEVQKMEFISAVPVSNSLVKTNLGPAFLPCFMNRGSDVQVTFLNPESVKVYGVLPPGNESFGNNATNQLTAFEQFDFFERPLTLEQLSKNAIEKVYIKVE